MMTLNALFSECCKCGGQGMWTPPMLENGGGSKTFFSPRNCPDCDGVGAIATEEGQEILDLINRWRRGGQFR